ncbi:MAG: PIG-L family deacetylase [Candidatus Bathyarchaeota archaeon]|nr:PIG-L family deacetylase [Candidatus Bathyarchaeota archaeon]MDH5689178.1 PIG-L family deacetylase [Candidatus Bathyarchaeota archaeon]
MTREITPVWLFDIPKPKALLVVAHPDDETIFTGGLILSSRNTHWTIVCCTETPSRRAEFISACELLAEESSNPAKSILLGLIADHIEYSSLVDKLKAYSVGYDIVFTHNRQGEYGHEDHKLVHRCVVESIANPNTWVFISPGSSNVNQEVLRSLEPCGNYVLEVSPTIRRLKTRIFQECHASQSQLYGYDSSGNLRQTDLRETLYWYFENPGREECTFYR